MPGTHRLTELVVGLHLRIAGDDRERGDVPGWVMITLMTAAIVTVLWAVAQPALQGLLDDALKSVKGPS